MSWRADIRASIYAAAEAALPDMNTQVDAMESNRFSIQSMLVAFHRWVQDGSVGSPPGIEPPFLVYDWGHDRPYEGKRASAIVTREWHVDIYYATSLAYPDGKTTDEYMEELEAAANLIAGYFRRSELDATAKFQVVQDAEFDFGAGNAANQLFQAFNLPYVAVSIGINLRYSGTGLI